MKKKPKSEFHEWLESQKIQYSIGSSISINRLYTGALHLDVVLEGGIPENKVTLIYGDKGLGKTVLALNIAARAQSQGKNVLYIDCENAVSPSIIRNLGLDSMTIINPSYLEEMGSVLLESVKEYSFIVIDSLTSLSPVLEFESSLEEMQQALGARVLGKMFRKLNGLLMRHKCTVVVLNQVRENIGYIKTFVLPGGKAQEFVASVMIYLRSSEFLEHKGVSEDQIRKLNEKRRDIQKVVFEISKSRVSSPRKSGNILLTVSRLKDHKIGEFCNERILFSWLRDNVVSMEWFPEYKTQTELFKGLGDFEQYKKIVNVIVENLNKGEISEEREEDSEEVQREGN